MAAFPKYNFVNITASGDTLVRKGHGTLHNLVVNTTAASTIVIYDGISAGGTKIASIAASPVIGSSFRYDVEFTNGLFVSTAGASDITLSIG